MGSPTKLDEILKRSGEMGRLTLEKDWSRNALGAIGLWPQSLGTEMSICLASRFPIQIWWSPKLVVVYNDAYIAIAGAKHPDLLGTPGSEAFAEIWDIIGPMFSQVMSGGEATWSEDMLLLLDRNGYLEECACTATCASVCGNGAPGNCLDAWAGNPPLQCKTCLVSPTGCGASWDACISDDGVPPAGSGSTSAGGGGGSCTCQTTAQLCPGGGSGATPGPFDGPGNDACGSAEYRAPCCDPGDACATQGACKMTLIDQAPCSMDYECCSGVCTAGKCDGGCGILISF